MTDGRLDHRLRGLPPAARRIHRAEIELGQPFVDVVGRFAHEQGTVALLSGGDHDTARYHILGLWPWLTLRERDGAVMADFDGQRVEIAGDPFVTLDALWTRYRLSDAEESPLSAGLLGYFAYDLKDCLEVLPQASRDDLGLPRLYLVAPSVLLVHDRRSGRTTVAAPVFGADGEATVAKRLERLAGALGEGGTSSRSVTLSAGKLRSGLARDRYIESVERIRDYIARGHVYQVNLSQRFAADFTGDPFALFAELFVADPAPFFAFIQAEDHQIVSTSPERFIELRGRAVETRPIKGTRPRGQTPEHDRQLRGELAASPKDEAELAMIVDLLRNDLGKVCAAGSVQVYEHKRIESYGNVHHLVSVVRGQLDGGQSAVDLIRATFPGGSITGCPKIRAMEIIDELEPVRRHVYTGAIGYLGFGGTMDLSIAIRTATIAGGRIVFSVGGGVVFDSRAADEFEETLHKGRSIALALGEPWPLV
jgi:para-aminobenzoate synthetase component 1